MKLGLLLAASALVSFTAQAAPGGGQERAGISAPRTFGSWGVDLAAGDRTLKPGDSFHQYANGTWLKSVQIDADKPGAGVSTDVAELTRRQLRALIEESARAPKNENEKKIGALYASFMDEAQIEQLGDAPLQKDLARVKAISTKAEMASYMGRSWEGFASTMFAVQVVPNPKEPKVYTPGLVITAMGLPTREYYLAEQFKPQREVYEAHIARSLKLAGWSDADAAARAIVAFETKVAEASWTLAEQRDPIKSYRPMSLARLKAHAPDFDWDGYFAASGAPEFPEIIVGQDTAVPKVAKLFADEPLSTLQAWQAYRIIDGASAYLPKRFTDNRFQFTSALSGQQQNRPRWQRGVSLVDGSLGEAVGQEYVRRHFPASSKKMMQEMVSNLQEAMRDNIREASWMTPETRAAALDKLAKQRVKVGYPDKWRDYSSLQIDQADLYGNVERAMAFANRFELDRIGKPVDRNEWYMTPQTVNAYFSPLGNEIVFPAAMLQAPYFDPKADAAVNYGAIGAVIGHEITHGFDDQGRQFDQNGSLRDWWQPADAARFQAEAAKLAAQYDSYEGLPGLKVNGKLTLGENIGDQGGVRIALDAYHKTLNGRPARRIGGFTGDQRFFLAFAQAWRNTLRDEMMKMVLVSDVHSPYRWRVDGTLRNVDEWYAAFNVKPGDKLYLPPQERVRVW